MPVVLTFDLQGAQPSDHNRIQSLFERFGWENLGGSSYRYPRLGTKNQPVEDWFNHVVPALMLFRAYTLSEGRQIRRFTVDAQSSSGYNPETEFGSPPLAGEDITFYDPKNQQFGKSNLVEWLDKIRWPY